MIMENKEDMIKGADELYKSATKSLNEFRKAWTEYFNKYGDGNGMSYVYELVRFSEKIDSFEDKCKKVHERVKEHINEKFDKRASIQKRNFKK